MKLRLHANTARLRLDQQDIARLRAEGRVTGETRFGPATRLTYAVEVVPTADAVAVRPQADGFTVLIPDALARAWIDTDRVGFTCEHATGTGDPLHVTVEKDFQCLHSDRPADAAAFPNPGTTA